jgi:hypothetical protein
MRPTVLLSAAACALLAAAAVPAAAQSDTSRAARERAERAREEARERARRARRELEDAERDLARAEREARANRARDERARRRDAEADDDLGIGEVGRVVGEAVREGMRGAAEGMRAASEAMRAGGYDDDGSRAVAPTRIDTTVSVGRTPTVDLSLISGPVTVTAWNRADVRVRATSTNIPLRFEASDGAVRVSTVRARTRSGGDQRLEVEVPVGTRVIARSVSGDVRVRGVRGEIEANSTSGNVEADGGSRNVTLRTVSGNVRGAALDGVLSVQSVSGDIELDDVAGELGAQSTSGDVRLRRGRLNRLRAETVSGDVTYDGSIARDGRYDLTSHSGDIRLALPANAGAALSVRTYSGTIDSNIPLVLRPAARGEPAAPRRMEFTVGGGGAQVTAESFSGTITIARP